LKTTIGILPAAGLAQRMNGIPKFMLPIGGSHRSLLDYHADLIGPFVEKLVCATRPSWAELVQLHLDGRPKVVVKATVSDSMTETVVGGLSTEKWDWALIGMPDTLFHLGGGNPYAELAATIERHCDQYAQPTAPGLVLVCFPTATQQEGVVGSILLDETLEVSAHADKNPSKNFGHHWGLMAINRAGFSLFDIKTPHTGYVIDVFLEGGHPITAAVSKSSYIDCGTFDEYRRAISQ
jgi:CTP:molybdopterin cytidylyltransferase MocA